MVLFCDLGIGIPGSLPQKRPQLWRRLLSIGVANSDSHVIAEAVKLSVTRTGKHYRGKGLKQLQDAVRDHEEGALTIYSNRGVYNWKGGTVTYDDYESSIMGTLIQWRIPHVQHQRSLF